MKTLVAFAIVLTLLVQWPHVASADLVLSGTSYSQGFNSIGSGLPAHWTARTGANRLGLTNPILGSSASFTTTNTSWSTTTGSFRNSASTQLIPGGAAATSTQQSQHNDRVFGVRQTGAFGDAGAAFTLRLRDTLGFQGFTVSFEAHMMDVQPRETTWTVRWLSGTNPTSFTELGTFTPTTFGSTNQSFSFGSNFNNDGQVKWIQIAALDVSTGSGNRDTFGIDDFKLSYSAVPEPSAFWLVGMAICSGLARRRRSRN
jgi:hypothetical protein